MLCDAIGMSHGCVVLIQASDSVHFVVDAAGDVLNVLHVGPGRNIKEKHLEMTSSDNIFMHEIRKKRCCSEDIYK